MNKENDFKNDFFTKEQLQECIDINIRSIITKLDNYIYIHRSKQAVLHLYHQYRYQERMALF